MTDPPAPAPVDLRLAVPAAAAWVAAALAVAWPAQAGLRLAVVAGIVAAASLAASRRLAAAAAAGIALGALAAAVHVAQVRAGPVAGLAHRQARAELTLSLVRDPVRRDGPHRSSYVLADATVTGVDGRGVHSPVLVIAHGPGWTGLLPGQRLRAAARLREPTHGHDLAAVALATGAPTLLGRPPWWQRAAGYVRARLRDACAGLPPDERGLVPGLVVGDVSRMPPSLTTAFQVSGLTHVILSQ